MKRLVGVAILGALSTSTSASDEYAERWERVSAEHDRLIATDDGIAYERELIQVHNTFWREVYVACNSQAKQEGVEFFRAVAVIDERGTVTEFLPNPNSQHFKCFADEMVGKVYPPPPIAPFYERFKIGLVDE